MTTSIVSLGSFRLSIISSTVDDGGQKGSTEIGLLVYMFFPLPLPENKCNAS